MASGITANDDFLRDLGWRAVGSRMRRLADRVFADVAGIYADDQVQFEPRWFPLINLLGRCGPTPVVEAARRLGQSHPAVSLFARELAAAGLIRFRTDRADERKRVLTLTPRGAGLYRQLAALWERIDRAAQGWARDAGVDALDALARLEDALAARGLRERVRTEQPADDGAVRIAPFDERWAGHFKRLNLHWLEEHFSVEPHDFELLDDPQQHYVAAGGEVFFALVGEQVAGTVALKPLGGGRWELAKLAVDPAFRGRGLGEALVRAVAAEARRRGGTVLWLETAKKLGPAIALYHKLGFVEVAAPEQPTYARTDYYMELPLAARGKMRGARQAC